MAIDRELTSLDAFFGPDDVVLFCHAHPDDETLSTGALIAALSRAGVPTHVVTATRGEMGETVPGSLPAGADLITVRIEELTAASRILGLHSTSMLGTPPARVPGSNLRVYRDSGMRWLADGRAGASLAVTADAFTLAEPAEPIADLAALIDVLRPTVLVSYDANGGYGHPDHVRMSEVSMAAAKQSDLRFLTVAPDSTASGYHWLDLSAERDRVLTAMKQYRTQFSLMGSQIRHVGGQLQPIDMRIGLLQAWPRMTSERSRSDQESL